MMYNRYIPQPDGSYRRSRAGEPDRPRSRPPKPEPQKQQPPTPAAPQSKPKQAYSPPQQYRKPQEISVDSFLRKLLPEDFDTGDLLVVILLLLMAGDCTEDRNNALLTMALYFLM